jgi:hypothetical protein
MEIGTFRMMTYNNIEEMPNSSEESSRKYDRISLEVPLSLTKTRQRLVREVMEEKRSLMLTAERLRIKLSTAKVILKRYKTKGTFFETKNDQRKRKESQASNTNEDLVVESGRTVSGRNIAD